MLKASLLYNLVGILNWFSFAASSDNPKESYRVSLEASIRFIFKNRMTADLEPWQQVLQSAGLTVVPVAGSLCGIWNTREFELVKSLKAGKNTDHPPREQQGRKDKCRIWCHTGPTKVRPIRISQANSSGESG
jgi:hypothetical protein